MRVRGVSGEYRGTASNRTRLPMRSVAHERVSIESLRQRTDLIWRTLVEVAGKQTRENSHKSLLSRP